MDKLALDALDYISNTDLPPIWVERFWRLFRIYREKTVKWKFKTRHLYTIDEAMVLAHMDLKRWKETGEL